MKNKVSFIDASGQRQEVTLTMAHWRAAQESNMTLRGYLNTQYPTMADSQHDTFSQMCASVGLIAGEDSTYAIRSTPIKHVLDGPLDMSAGPVTSETTPVQSRLLFPAYMLQFIENKMTVDRSSAVSALNEMVAMTTTVPGFRAEQPVISYERAGGPEGTRAQPRAQLAKPSTVLSITASERQLAIPEKPIAVEISDQATIGTTLDLVGLALTRQREVEGFKQAGEDLLGLLNGNPDIASMTAALSQTKAVTLDSSISAAGELTDLAYEKWLYQGISHRVITHVVTDYDGARAIEHRTGRLLLNDSYPTDRRIVREGVFYPNLVDSVRIYIVDPDMVAWPANTILGLDSSAAIQKIISAAASYSDVERFVMRRGTGFVVSYGEIMIRIFDDAFSVLSLTL